MILKITGYVFDLDVEKDSNKLLRTKDNPLELEINCHEDNNGEFVHNTIKQRITDTPEIRIENITLVQFIRFFQFCCTSVWKGADTPTLVEIAQKLTKVDKNKAYDLARTYSYLRGLIL